MHASLNTNRQEPLFCANDEALEQYPNVCEGVDMLMDENMDPEVVENEDAQNSRCIAFTIGDATKVKRNCLSVLRMFSDTPRLKHPAT